MGTPYDYVTVVKDPEWSLVKIVPHDAKNSSAPVPRPIIEPVLPPKITEAVIVGGSPHKFPPTHDQVRFRPRNRNALVGLPPVGPSSVGLSSTDQ
jgi:hypothetical protein